MDNVAKIIMFIGFFGLIAISALNFYAYDILGKAASAPFSSKWWGQWFVLYLIMGSFLLIGLGLYFFKVKA